MLEDFLTQFRLMSLRSDVADEIGRMRSVGLESDVLDSGMVATQTLEGISHFGRLAEVFRQFVLEFLLLIPIAGFLLVKRLEFFKRLVNLAVQ